MSAKAKPLRARASADDVVREDAATAAPDHLRASVSARKATVAATMRRPKDATVVVDDGETTGPVRVETSGIRVRRTAVDRVDDPPPATGPVLIERVTRAIERELLKIEAIVGGHHLKPQQRTEAERRARTLASLARTLGEVTRLRTEQQKVKPADDDSVPRDLDEFRRTLSRRLEQLVGVAAPVSAAGAERDGA
ncbi:MAG TPA: hypothetical protein VHC94_04300 [Nitrobacter sp.]|nr:hypothetical protein [Nitrobacter sp.]